MMTTDERNEFLTRHWPAICWAARRAGRAYPQIDPDDLIGETGLVVIRRFDAFDPAKGAFLTWLCSVARSVVDDLAASAPARRAARTCSLDALALPSGDRFDVVDPRAADPAEVAAEADQRRANAAAVAAAMRKLTPAQRAAVRRRAGFRTRGDGGPAVSDFGQRFRARSGLARLRGYLDPLIRAAV
jgi:RNA polymerase sigma factor (sigma-70 family)